jgi:hypothetical protein
MVAVVMMASVTMLACIAEIVCASLELFVGVARGSGVGRALQLIRSLTVTVVYFRSSGLQRQERGDSSN